MFDWIKYDPHTGEFWSTRGGTTKRVGSANRQGYIILRWGKKTYKGHRVAWYLTYGDWPPKGMDIDHINRVRGDNRLSNLRLATKQMNAHNRECRGWSWHSTNRRYQAYIRCDRVLHHLGYWDTPEEARAAYLRAKLYYHPTVLDCPKS